MNSIKRSGTVKGEKTSALQRSATRKAAALTRKKKTLEDVQQGIKELYSPEGNQDVDIVLVPGLGAHPEDSWKSSKNEFNWTKDVLSRDFPKSRILLYMYESAWIGPLQVQQYMGAIAKSLLVALRALREGKQRTPIVFIGHSMGGLVIAKAITLMASLERDSFSSMFEATASCVFFGTPFGGAIAAACAAMYAYAADKFNKSAQPSKLLELMSPGNEELRTLKNDFMRLVNKLEKKINVICFYEERQTDWAKVAGLPSFFKVAIPKGLAEFVTRGSATIAGVDEQGLAANHRDLVKFDSSKDIILVQFILPWLRNVINAAPSAVRSRLSATRHIDRGLISDILDALKGAHPDHRRKLLLRNFEPSSWITQVLLFKEWLEPFQISGVGQRDCLWIRGPEGRGKTIATMAILDGVESQIRLLESGESEHNIEDSPFLLAYFFCEEAEEYSTAEDLLKSLISQIISRKETLASHAKAFAKKKGKDQETRQQSVQPTVENLWQVLQAILGDFSETYASGRIYFVINNLHVLHEDSESTAKLLQFVRVELIAMADSNSQEPNLKTRWLITSRDTHSIKHAFGDLDMVKLIDLEDEKFGNQVQLELRKHAKKKIDELELAKNYNKAIAYYASSLIGRRGQNTQWIDITCVQLQQLPKAESDLMVRRVLEQTPHDLKTLLNSSWNKIFESCHEDAEKTKELLRSLVLTYEDPTEDELGVLGGLWSTPEEKKSPTWKAELRKLVGLCTPLLTVTKGVVSFMNAVVRTHLLENSDLLLGLAEEETKWQHGVLAHRAFAHLRIAFDFPESQKTMRDVSGDGQSNGVEAVNESSHGESDDGSESEGEGSELDSEIESFDSFSDGDLSWSDESEDDDPEAPILVDKAESYAVKFWLRHASEATVEIAEDLSQDEEFWKPGSNIRRRWTIEFARMTDKFERLEHKSLSALHIAASIGFRQLVNALIRARQSHKDEVNEHDSLFNTPLHLAAWFGRLDIVEELLDHDAVIDDGADEENATPLAMAAERGNVEVMKKLMLRGANPNTNDKDDGPVINAAISSGNQAAVELLVDTGKAALWVDRDDIESPLELAASSLSDISMFNYLIERYADQLPPAEYSKALIAASRAGQLEVFNKLAGYRHPQDQLQRAVEAAADEDNWNIVHALLGKYPGLQCDEILYKASISFEDKEEILNPIWKYTTSNSGGHVSAAKIDESLYEATDREKFKTVKFLLENFNANPNATGEEFGNALTAAAYDGNLPILKLLLSHGADVNAAEGYAIQTAAYEGHTEVVEELIRWNANVNAFARDESFEPGTALQAACESSKLDIVRLLLQHGANPNLGRGEYSPPIIAASVFGDGELLKELVFAQANIDVLGGPDQSSALINAATYHPVSTLILLVEAGADVNLPNAAGNTALIVACEYGDDESVALLLDNGADMMRSNQQGVNALQTALDNDWQSCLELLVDRISALFELLETAMKSGDTVIWELVQRVASLKRSVDLNRAQASRRHSHSEGSEGNSTDNDSENDQDREGDAASATSNATDFHLPQANRSSAASYDKSINESLSRPAFSTQLNADQIPTYRAAEFEHTQLEGPVHEGSTTRSREETLGTGNQNHIRRKPAPPISSSNPSTPPSFTSILDSDAFSSVSRTPMTTPQHSSPSFAAQRRNDSDKSYSIGSGDSTPDPSMFGNLFETSMTIPTPLPPQTAPVPNLYRDRGGSLTNSRPPYPPRYPTEPHESSAAAHVIWHPGQMERGQLPTTPSPRSQDHPPALRPGYGTSNSEGNYSQYRGVDHRQNQQFWQQRLFNQQRGYTEPPSPSPPQNNPSTDGDRQQQSLGSTPRRPFWRR